MTKVHIGSRVLHPILQGPEAWVCGLLGFGYFDRRSKHEDFSDGHEQETIGKQDEDPKSGKPCVALLSGRCYGSGFRCSEGPSGRECRFQSTLHAKRHLNRPIQDSKVPKPQTLLAASLAWLMASFSVRAASRRCHLSDIRFATSMLALIRDHEQKQ